MHERMIAADPAVRDQHEQVVEDRLREVMAGLAEAHRRLDRGEGIDLEGVMQRLDAALDLMPAAGQGRLRPVLLGLLDDITALVAALTNATDAMRASLHESAPARQAAIAYGRRS